MKKTLRMLTLVLSLMLTLTGVAAAEALDEPVLATVDGVPVPIEGAFAEYAVYADAYEMYGFGEGAIESLREDVARDYVRMFLIYTKADALGLTEALDAAAVQAEADQLFEETLALYMDYYADPEATEEENRAYCTEQLKIDGYTPEDAYQDAFDRGRMRALVAHCSEGTVVTDEETRKHYDDTLAAQIESYGKYISNFESDWEAGRPVYYIPEGVRYVKHILVSLSSGNQSELYNLELERTALENSRDDEGADVEAIDAQIAEINQKIEAIYGVIMPRIEEIQGRIEAGEDFLALMAEYGEDPGMQQGSNAYETGYMVWENCSSWVKPFTEGSMSLKEVGEVTGPVYTSYGIHLIRYESDLPARTVPFEEVQEAIHADLLNDKVNGIFMNELTKWEEEAEIVMFDENLELLRQEAREKAAAEAAAAAK